MEVTISSLSFPLANAQRGRDFSQRKLHYQLTIDVDENKPRPNHKPKGFELGVGVGQEEELGSVHTKAAVQMCV